MFLSVSLERLLHLTLGAEPRTGEVSLSVAGRGAAMGQVTQPLSLRSGTFGTAWKALHRASDVGEHGGR